MRPLKSRTEETYHDTVNLEVRSFVFKQTPEDLAGNINISRIPLQLRFVMRLLR